MKNVFEFYKDSDEYAGAHFVKEELQSEEMSAIDEYNEMLEEHKKLWQIPLYLKIIQFASAILAIIALLAIVRSEVTFKEAFVNAPYIFIGGGIALVAAVTITVLAKIKERNYAKSEDYAKLCEMQKKISIYSKKRLSIPENAEMIDVLASFRKENKGKDSNALAFDFVPSMMYAYADEDNLYLADCAAVYAFPRSCITGIEEIEKRVTLGEWHKNEAPTSQEYKKHKMTVDGAGFVHLKSYFSLALKADEEELQLLFPPYDIKIISTLCGMPLDIVEQQKTAD